MGKFIDEKGRLFGKINVIDFLVIMFLALLLPMAYCGYKIMTKKTILKEEKGQVIEIETYCRMIKLNPETLKVLSVGDNEVDDNGIELWRIIELGKITPYEHVIDMGNGETILKDDSDLKQVMAKIRLRTKLIEKDLYYKDRLLKVGEDIELKIDNYNIQCIIYGSELKQEKRGCQDGEDVIVKAILQIKVTNLMPEIVKVIKEGDTQKEIIRDSSGMVFTRTIVRVLRIITNKPSEVITLFESGEWLVKGHPKNRDLILELEALCIKRADGLFLGGADIKIGKSLVFFTDLYLISGTVISLKLE